MKFSKKLIIGVLIVGVFALILFGNIILQDKMADKTSQDKVDITILEWEEIEMPNGQIINSDKIDGDLSG